MLRSFAFLSKCGQNLNGPLQLIKVGFVELLLQLNRWMDYRDVSLSLAKINFVERGTPRANLGYSSLPDNS